LTNLKNLIILRMSHEGKANLPHFLEIGADKIDNLFGIFQRQNLSFNKVLLLTDYKTLTIGGNKIATNFEAASIEVVREIVQDSSAPIVYRIKGIIFEKKPDLVIGFGGGKVLDVAKLAAGENNTRFICVATTLSNDGIASPVSVIKDEDNIPISHLTKAPYGVVVDIGIIKKAPIRYLRAGVGDLISNLSAVFDARIAQTKKQEIINSTALSLAETGPKRLLDLDVQGIKSNEFLLCLTKGLIESGLAMCIVGSSRPASGSEHKISHALDRLFPPRKTLHGEQVGIAAIFTMALQGNKFLNQVRHLYKRIAFPQSLEYLGITSDEFVRIVFNARYIRPERYTILDEKKLTAKKIKRIIQEMKL